MRVQLIIAFCVIFLDGFSQSWQNVQLFPSNEYSRNIIACTAFGDTAVALNGYGKIATSNNLFSSFTIDSSNKNIAPDAMCFANRQIGFVTSAYVRGGMLKTVNGGKNWYPLQWGAFSGINIGNILFFVNSDTAYSAYTFDQSLNATRDSWFTWTTKSTLSPKCKRIFDIQFINDSTGFILGSKDADVTIPSDYLYVFKSTNYGNDWQIISELPFLSYGNLLFTDDTTVIVATSQTILKSSNGGVSFDVVMQSNDPNEIFQKRIMSISFANHDTGFVAFPYSVYKTTNAGNTWIKTDFNFDNLDYYNQINFITAISGNKAIVGCDNGNIYKTATGGGIWSGVKGIAAEEIFTIYPNPTTGKLNCKVSNATQNATIHILSIEGKVMLQNILATQPNFEIDVSPLPAGLYFLEWQNDIQRVVKKFVKQ